MRVLKVLARERIASTRVDAREGGREGRTRTRPGREGCRSARGWARGWAWWRRSSAAVGVGGEDDEDARRGREDDVWEVHGARDAVEG